MSRSKKPRIADRDEALFVFGSSRGAALKRYRKAMEWNRDEHWVQGVPGTLPWWRLGRPPRKGSGVSLKLDAERTRIGMDGLSTGPVRDAMPIEAFVECTVAELGCAPEQLASRTIEATVVEARETIALLGVERYGYKVKDLAAAFAKNPETVSRMIGRALHRKAGDKSYRRLLDKLDREVAERAGLSKKGMAT
ncbi:MAG: hypothetical protein GY906_31710 [bacterium]|nr:hypothetical protein [bacterium]